MSEELISKVVSYSVNGLIGIFGGIANYMYSVSKGNIIFKFSSFFAQGFISGFVTIATNEFIPKDREIRIGLLFVAGFLSVKILDFFQEEGFDFMMRRFFGRDYKKDDKEDKTDI